MTLTHEWQEYDMDYQKAVQDIRTKDGKEYLNCWPNAGKWCVMSDNSQPDIPDAEVTHVKLNKSWMSEEQEAAVEKRIPVIGYNCDEETADELERGITMEIKNPYPLATVDEYTDIIGPYHRKRKPNTGLKIGSYRYKSK